jgi:hypothetical protein
MYTTPELVKFGTFRELTLQSPNNVKRTIGDDLVPGIGLDCSTTVPTSDPRACLRS